MCRLILLFLGFLTLIGLIWHIGPIRILDATTALSAIGLLVILLPSLLMYALETWGWRLTLGRHAGAVTFWRLFAVRTAGEVVNLTTPTAYVGGEPVKAYLLKRHGVPLVDGLASVVTAKTTMTIAEVAFILLGVGVAVFTIGTPAGPSAPANRSGAHVLGAALSVGLLLFGTALLVAAQRRGLFSGLLGLLRRCRIHVGFLEAREEKLRALDRTILDFYVRDRRAYRLSTGVFFLGWMAEALEVYAILYVLGGSKDFPAALSIGALSVFIKGGTFFIPGSLGAQEGGNLMLLLAYGYSDLTGITFALLRRLRELVWIAIGLLCLTVLGGRGTVLPQGEIPGP